MQGAIHIPRMEVSNMSMIEAMDYYQPKPINQIGMEYGGRTSEMANYQNQQSQVIDIPLPSSNAEGDEDETTQKEKTKKVLMWAVVGVIVIAGAVYVYKNYIQKGGAVALESGGQVSPPPTPDPTPPVEVPTV